MESTIFDKPESPQSEENLNKSNFSGDFDKLNVHNWLFNKPSITPKREIIEIKFKNTRKGFYLNVNNLNLSIGDFVAVEGNPGHDIGVVSLIGDTILEQLRKNRISPNSELRKIYRKAKQSDIDKWKEAMALEHKTMLESRKLARDMGLNMKIGDVEFQGDKTKAIFYYIADERIDFRQLIKILADKYRIRIEMKQIGARQEAGRIGGISSCGRELCCSTWIGNFVSVATNVARVQELSLNPQKLAGQCSKLKCCLNYELDCYLDARKKLPHTETVLRTKEGNATHLKTDVFKSTLWYSFENQNKTQIVTVSAKRAKEIIELNRKNILPEKLVEKEDTNYQAPEKMDFQNVVGQDSLDRFNRKKSKGRDNRSRNKSRNPRNKHNSNQNTNPNSDPNL